MFDSRPAIIGARHAAVDLFILAADVVDEQLARSGADGERERISQSQRPDRPVLAGRLLPEGIVAGNRSVDVNSQDFALKSIEPLRRRFRGLLANGNVHLPITAKMNRSSLMPRRDFASQCALIVSLQQNLLATVDGGVFR